jgi:hypothetical protein
MNVCLTQPSTIAVIVIVSKSLSQVDKSAFMTYNNTVSLAGAGCGSQLISRTSSLSLHRTLVLIGDCSSLT